VVVAVPRTWNASSAAGKYWLRCERSWLDSDSFGRATPKPSLRASRAWVTNGISPNGRNPGGPVQLISRAILWVHRRTPRHRGVLFVLDAQPIVEMITSSAVTAQLRNT
jgi:hypothetical protein